MDPLDQHLTDAGRAWRQTQPEPPDLDRMVARLDHKRSRGLAPRIAIAFVAAGLALVVAVAVGPRIGGLLQHGSPAPAVGAGVPTAAPSQGPATRPSATPSAAASPSVSPSDDPDVVSELVGRYEDALVAGDWTTAFDLLAATSPTHDAGASAFAAEREPFYASVDGQYTVGEPSRVTDLTAYAPLVDGADASRAYLIEVDYPAIGGNAGYEQFVVAPDPSGAWRIWPVR